MTAASARAFSWQLWRRGRGTAAALLLYGGALSLLAHLPGAGGWRETLLTATIPLGFGSLFFLAGFAFPEGDVLARHSGFPGWMLVAPARTWELALWPMLHGAAAAVLCWLLPVRGIFAPLGVPVPLWPAAVAAALLAALQALLWTPFALPYLRVALAVLFAPLLVTAGGSAASIGASPGLLAAAFGAVAVLAYPAAVAGLSRARRGDVPEWSLRSPCCVPRAACCVKAGAGRSAGELPSALTQHRERSEARSTGSARTLSPFQAQLRYEWQAGGRALPLLIAVLGGVFSLPFLWVRELAPLQPGAPEGSVGALSVNLWLKMLLPGLYALPLLAAVVGCGRRRSEGRRELALPWFVAVRPLEDRALVAARFGMAARSTTAAWGIALGVVAIWLLLPARDGARSGPLLLLLPAHFTPRDAFVALVALGFLVLWTWKNQVQGLWADVSGRPLLVHGAPVVAHSAFLAAIVLFPQHSGPGEPGAGVSSAFWIAASGALALKTLAATVALCALRRQRQEASRPAPGETLGLRADRLLAGWLVTALALGAALISVAQVAPRPGSLAELTLFIYLPFLHPIGLPLAYREPLVLLLGTLLFVPLARLAAAPLTLGWNRRR